MTIVITSKRAKKDIERIKGRHKEILEGMSAQAERVRQHEEMKKQEAMATQERQQGILRENREASQRDKEIALKQT